MEYTEEQYKQGLKHLKEFRDTALELYEGDGETERTARVIIHTLDPVIEMYEEDYATEESSKKIRGVDPVVHEALGHAMDNWRTMVGALILWKKTQDIFAAPESDNDEQSS